MSGECDLCGENILYCLCGVYATRPNNGWIDVEKELPPMDGVYEVTSRPGSPVSQACLLYDGFGFYSETAYRPVRYWRYHIELKKKYGKVASTDTPPSGTVTNKVE